MLIRAWVHAYMFGRLVHFLMRQIGFWVSMSLDWGWARLGPMPWVYSLKTILLRAWQLQLFTGGPFKHGLLLLTTWKCSWSTYLARHFCHGRWGVMCLLRRNSKFRCHNSRPCPAMDSNYILCTQHLGVCTPAHKRMSQWWNIDGTM